MMNRTALALAILSAFWLTACGGEQAAVAPEPPPPVPIGAEVSVTGRVVQGVVAEDGLKQYHGIPYAAPPTGDRRWAPRGRLLDDEPRLMLRRVPTTAEPETLRGA